MAWMLLFKLPMVIIMFCKVEKECQLYDIIGDSQEVTCLHINKISFGDANGNARLEISKNGKFLHIYTEDDFVSVAKMQIKNIYSIGFGMVDIHGYTGESYELRSEYL